MIAGETEPDQGSIEVGETIRIGYFAQEEQEMDDRQRVIDYVKDIAEYINTREGRISASAMLERFLFTPDMQYARSVSCPAVRSGDCICLACSARRQMC